jgi:hypothetical protein
MERQCAAAEEFEAFAVDVHTANPPPRHYYRHARYVKSGGVTNNLPNHCQRGVVSAEDVLVSSPRQVSATPPRWISWRRLRGECLRAVSEADVLALANFLSSPDVCISTTKKPASLSRWFIDKPH